MMHLLLVWFVAVNAQSNLQPYAVVTDDCTRSFNQYTEERQTILDSQWRHRCIPIPTINQLEKSEVTPLP